MNQRLGFVVFVVVCVAVVAAIVVLLLLQRKRHKLQLQQANAKYELLTQKLNQTKAEKEVMSQEIGQIINDKDNRQELETLTPSVLQKSGETKFRMRFELLYPLFLPRLRERVPSITRREELLSMLLVLKQDNKDIAELLAIEPRSVLMLRHRFRQKIGMTAEHSLENFIEEILRA
jgi:DNA-binding CsgD family transcriptional regulator